MGGASSEHKPKGYFALANSSDETEDDGMENIRICLTGATSRVPKQRPSSGSAAKPAAAAAKAKPAAGADEASGASPQEDRRLGRREEKPSEKITSVWEDFEKAGRAAPLYSEARISRRFLGRPVTP